MHPWKRAASIGVLLAAFASAAPRSSAVSQSRPSQRDPSKIDACALLRSEEIEAATGWAPQSAKPETHGRTATCTYQHAKGTRVRTVALVVGPSTRKLASSAEMADWRSQQLKRHPDIKVVIKPVEGLGVPAISSQVEGTETPTLEAYAKGKLLSLAGPSLEVSKALAAKAIARLP